MHVVLVRPPTCTGIYAGGEDACAPIGLAYLAANLKRSGHKVSVVDAVGLALDRWERVPELPGSLAHGLSIEETVRRIPTGVDLIGVSCMFSREWPYTRRVVIAIKKAFRSVPIVAGGEHVTACPDYVFSASPVDYCIVGEGDETIAELATILEKENDPHKVVESVAGVHAKGGGRILHGKRRGRIRNINYIPWPEWSLFPIEDYIAGGFNHGEDHGRSMPMIASRGCPYECAFCSNPIMWTQYWNVRRPEDVVEEIKLYKSKYNITNIDFMDLTAIVKKSWIVEFCNLLIKENVDITWQLPSGTRSEAIDFEVAGLLYRSGCRNITYAPESGNDLILKEIKKKIKKEKMLESMRSSFENGLQIKANIIIGFPYEKKRDLIDTFRFLYKMAKAGVNDISIYPFCPYPGSELFEQQVNRGNIRFDDNYFMTLGDFTSPFNAKSFCKYMSNFQIRFFICFGMAYFYILSFLLRPSKVCKFIANLFKRRQGSRLLKALLIVARKRMACINR